MTFTKGEVMNRDVLMQEFMEGSALKAYEYFGAHVSKTGTVFRTYAPAARGVNIFGDFNGWTEEPMERDDKGGSTGDRQAVRVRREGAGLRLS